jgi:hypothetical protein
MQRLYIGAIILLTGLLVPVRAQAQNTPTDTSVQSQPAQTPSGGTSSTSTTSTTPATTTTTTTSTTVTTSGSTTSNAQTRSSSYRSSGNAGDQFIVSGMVGGSYGGDANDGGVALDGSFDWLHNSAIGFEFLGAFSPKFNFDQGTLAAAGDTQTNSYMFNAIGAVPMGSDANWLPYVSGGFGAITFRNNIDVGTDAQSATFNNSLYNPSGASTINLIDVNQFGGNIGLGVMGFAKSVGLRFDVRYFSGIGNTNNLTTTANDNLGTDLSSSGVLNNLLQDVSFWRTTLGVSFRW